MKIILLRNAVTLLNPFFFTDWRSGCNCIAVGFFVVFFVVDQYRSLDLAKKEVDMHFAVALRPLCSVH